MAPTICAGKNPAYDNIPVFDIQRGALIVDRWTVPRGTGTLGVTRVRRVLEPAKWDRSTGRRLVVLRCRGDVYFGETAGTLPVLRVAYEPTP